jgi:DNA-binding MarR family transcriptional regulator
MSQDLDLDVDQLAAALRANVGLLLRRLRQVHGEGELTLPESSALVRLERGGPATPSALARLEQISPQSMGATLAALESRGLIERHSDPADGRRSVMSVTEAGRQVLGDRRNARTE